MNIGEIIQSKRWKVFTGYVYNLGASIVLLGALFKLQHWAYSGPILIIGLCTEAFIFFISAFEPPLELPEWSKVYPQLKEDYALMEEEEELPTSKFDELLKKAEISPDLLTKVSKGLTDLSNTASSISDISTATLATDMYVKNLNSAAESMNSFAEVNNQANDNINKSVGVLVDSYETTANQLASKSSEMLNKLSESGTEFTARLSDTSSKLVDSYKRIATSVDQSFEVIDTHSKGYGDNLTKLNKNLQDLNSSYENQLKETTNQLQSSQKFFAEMGQMNQIISSSVEEMKKYKENAEELNKHLEALNSIYGNMLGAMNYKKK
ncbi:type IX secretion system motor protein PorL/GldL [Sunxiuqinia sp. A32]|uniref:type IX secretion system motor protein PorL/GldL n=1 Tax=Sunxiuqinia sp. A32 TaxID=3461496 RepID=UPI004045BA66